MKPSAFVYCYLDVESREDPKLYQLEDNLIGIAASHNAEVTGIASDIPATKRAGLEKLERMLEDRQIQFVIVDDMAQFGKNEKFKRCLDHMIEQGVSVLTSRGKVEPDSLLCGIGGNAENRG